MSGSKRKTAVVLLSMTLVIALAAMPDRYLHQPADWLIDQLGSLRPNMSHRSHINTPTTACPELKSLAEPVEIQLAYKFPENNGIALVLRDLAGHTVDLYFNGPADKSGSWQILLGTIQPNKNNGRAVAPSSPEEKAILGLLQRWHSRLSPSRLAKGQRNDQNTMEIMTRLEERN